MSDERPMNPADSEFDHDLLLLEAELGELAREITEADTHLDQPPADIWVGIEAAAGHKATADHEESGAVVGLDQRGFWARGQSSLLAAAAVILLVGVGFIAVARSFGGSELVASAQISNEDLPVEFGGEGSVSLRRDGDDVFLELDLPELPSTAGDDAFYEVWMIDTNVEGMISLGGVSADGRIDLPDNVDHQRFPVVDISVEPFDGDPTHSGQSILRGVLTDVADA